MWTVGCEREGQLGFGSWKRSPHDCGGGGVELVERFPGHGAAPIRTLQCGLDYVVCIDEDSYLWSFGQNGIGQLGLGHMSQVRTPTRVEGVRARQGACGYADNWASMFTRPSHPSLPFPCYSNLTLSIVGRVQCDQSHRRHSMEHWIIIASDGGSQ